MGLINPPCCALFSICGLIFLGVMGAVISAAPIYIKGIKDPDAASTTCYWGAGLYAATFGISVALLVKERYEGEGELGRGRINSCVV